MANVGYYAFSFSCLLYVPVAKYEGATKLAGVNKNQTYLLFLSVMVFVDHTWLLWKCLISSLKNHYKPCCTSDQTLPAQTPIMWTLHCVGVERRLQWFTSSWLSKTRLCTNNNTGVEKMCQIGFGFLSVVGQDALSLYANFLGDSSRPQAQDSKQMTFNFVRSKTWLCFFSMLEWSFLLHQAVLCQRLNMSAFLFGPACVRLSCWHVLHLLYMSCHCLASCVFYWLLIHFSDFCFTSISVPNVKLGLYIYQGLINHHTGHMFWQY